MAAPRRILLTRLSALGDLVICTQYIAGLRQVYPDAHFTLLTSPLGEELFDGNPMIDAVICWRRKVSVLQDIVFLVSLRRQRFDLAIDLHASLPTGLAQIFVRAGQKSTVGQNFFAKALGLKHKSRPRKVSEMLAMAGDGLAPNLIELADLHKPILEAGAVAQHQVQDMLAQSGIDETRPLVLLAPGSSSNWPSKRWPLSHFSALVDWLAAGGYQPIIIGDDSERELGAEIVSRSTGAVDFIGITNLSELIALAQHATVTVANDSGPMHLSAAAGTPTLALFGPTDGGRHGPEVLHGSKHQFISLNLDCAPCHNGICPLRHHNCMEQMAIEQVTAVLKPMLTISVSQS